MMELLNFFYGRGSYLVFGYNIFISFLSFLLLTLSLLFLSKKLHSNTKYLLFLLFPTLFFFRLFLNDYFLSDDFDHFIVVNKFSFWELFRDGLLGNEVWAFHRLFVAFWIFKGVYLLFGPTYPAFLFTNYLLHVINIFLFYSFTKRLKVSNFASVVSTVLFSTVFLSWISNVHELIAGTFFLLSMHMGVLWAYSKKKEIKYLALGLLTYFLGTSSKEFIFLFPVVFLCFSVFYNSYVRIISFKRLLKRFTPFFVLFSFYALVFTSDYLNFSNFAEDGGYKTVFAWGSFLERLSFYISSRVPLISGVDGFVIFIIVLVLYDFLKRRFLLSALTFPFFVLLLPVSFLEKAEAYYSYVPSIFLFLLTLVLINEQTYVLKGLKDLQKLVVKSTVTAVLFIFVFGVHRDLQETIFLLQFPRDLARKVEIEKMVGVVEEKLKGVEEEEVVEISLESIENEYQWFIANGYLKYFLKDKRAKDYEYVYNVKEDTLTVIK